MVSVVSVVIDLAWASGLGVLGFFLVRQVRLLARPAVAPPEPEPVDDEAGAAPLLLPRRHRIRCVQCSRSFEILEDPEHPPTTIRCPGCGAAGPWPPRAGAPGPSPAHPTPGPVAPA